MRGIVCVKLDRPHFIGDAADQLLMRSCILAALLLLTVSCRNQEPKPTSSSQSPKSSLPTVDAERREEVKRRPDSVFTPPDGGAFDTTELLEAYESNELTADGMYKGKRVYIQGFVEKIGRDALGRPYIILQNTGQQVQTPETHFLHVEAFFPDSATTKLARLPQNYPVLLTGVCDGLIVNVLLSDSDLWYP